MRIYFIFLMGLIVLTQPGCLEAESDSMEVYTSVLDSHEKLGAARFLFGDFDGLNNDTLKTNALPWKVATTALIYRENRINKRELSRKSLAAIYKQYGLLTNPKILNWPYEQDYPAREAPVGFVKGIGKISFPKKYEIEISNVSCVACHSGTTYDSQGYPTLNLQLGVPNTSIHFNAMIQDVVDAIDTEMMDSAVGLKKIKTIYPEISKAEYNTLKSMYDKLLERIVVLKTKVKHYNPLDNGGPGLTNGLGSLKLVLGIISDEVFNKNEMGLTSVPDLSMRYLKSSLLYDGTYSIKGTKSFVEKSIEDTSPESLFRMWPIISYFKIPVMGEKPEKILQDKEEILEVLDFVKDFEPIPFPGAVDYVQANKGRVIFENKCAACHGQYEGQITQLHLTSFPNKLTARGWIATDMTRADLITKKLIKKVNLQGPANQEVDIAYTGSYVAPMLSNLWLSAPYLHNGSVPTLWHLMHPSERPVRFQHGGHKLDFVKMGIDAELNSQGNYIYRSNYVSWSRSEIFDTSLLGRGRQGHEKPFDTMSEVDKKSLLEFLKLL